MELGNTGERADKKIKTDDSVIQEDECIKFLSIYFERLMRKILFKKSDIPGI
jgi:hypothetical protein